MKELFREQQKTILKLLNSPYRKYFDIPHIQEKKIVGVFPNGLIQREGKNLKWYFWTKDIIVDELLRNNFLSYKQYKYAWLSNPFNTGAGDGHLRAENSTWSTVRNATTANDSTDYTGTVLRLDALDNGSTNFIGRGRLPFNTSALDDSVSINSASVYLRCTNVISSPYNGANVYLVNVSSPLASFTTLTADDYDNFGTTVQSDSQFDCTTTGDKTVSLNAAGIASISKTSFTDWGLRINSDQNNLDPSSTTGEQVSIATSENGTTAFRPLLTIVTPDQISVAGDFKFL